MSGKQISDGEGKESALFVSNFTSPQKRLMLRLELDYS